MAKDSVFQLQTHFKDVCVTELFSEGKAKVGSHSRLVWSPALMQQWQPDQKWPLTYLHFQKHSVTVFKRHRGSRGLKITRQFALETIRFIVITQLSGAEGGIVQVWLSMIRPQWRSYNTADNKEEQKYGSVQTLQNKKLIKQRHIVGFFSHFDIKKPFTFSVKL